MECMKSKNDTLKRNLPEKQRFDDMANDFAMKSVRCVDTRKTN